MASNKINSLVSVDAKQALITIADQQFNGNQTAALNSILLHIVLTKLDEPVEFQTWYEDRRCQAWAKPEVALGGDGWANIRTKDGIVPMFQEYGTWTQPEESEVLDKNRF